MKFLGLAAPGNPNISPDRDLVAFWRSMGENRFQNYEAYFTILNTGEKPISRKWISALIDNHKDSLQYAPDVWKKYIREGRNGIVALKAPKILKIPTRYDAEKKLPDEKPVFFIYTHGAPKGDFLKGIRAVTQKKNCPEIGEFRCQGYDTFGPFKLVGGIAKGHPTADEIQKAVEYYQNLQ